MDRPTCEGLRKDGGRCRSFSLPASAYCFLHGDPEAARAARSKGSVNAGKLRAIQGRRARLDSAGGLLRFMANVVHGALDGTIEPDVVKAVTYAASLQTKLIEVANLERQVAELERLQARRGPA